MKISELVQHLEHMRSEHGDLDVEQSHWDGRRGECSPPRLDHRAILIGRESKTRFGSEFYGKDAEGRRGDKVCRIA